MTVLLFLFSFFFFLLLVCSFSLALRQNKGRERFPSIRFALRNRRRSVTGGLQIERSSTPRITPALVHLFDIIEYERIAKVVCLLDD